jgi:hypothetical protein
MLKAQNSPDRNVCARPPCKHNSALAERLRIVRVHAYRVRVQINAAHDDDDRRRLLSDRLDRTDAMAADIHARLIESRAAA